jgi:hypothetical protein
MIADRRQRVSGAGEIIAFCHASEAGPAAVSRHGNKGIRRF